MEYAPSDELFIRFVPHQVAVQSVMGLMYLNGEYVRWTELQAMPSTRS